MTQVANLNTKLSLESASFISGIEKSRGAVRSLIASLDPAAAAQAKFNRETQLLDGALKRGQISAEAYGKGLEILRQRMTAATTASGGVIASHGQMRAGFQQLSFQIGDVANQWATGTKPMVIFAQQGGQVIQALGMMTNSTKGLLGFLGGPWGQILTAAAIVMVPLINKLWESEDASKAATDGVMGYVNALKQLQSEGGAFKFGSDEFKKVSTASLEAEARVAQLTQRLATMKNVAPIAVGPGGPAPVSSATIENQLRKAMSDRDARRSDLKALLLQQRNRAIADAPGSSSGTRSSGGGRGGSGSRNSGRGRSSVDLNRFDSQIAQQRQQQLGLLEGITSDVRQQASLQHDRVDIELEAYSKDVAQQVAQGQLTAEQAKQLLTVRERNAELEKTKINWALDDKLTQQDLEITQARLDNDSELMRGELDAARTQAERRRIQLAILENERQLQVAALEAVKAKHDTTDVEYKIAQAKLDQLDKETSQRAGAIQRGTMGPVESYLDRIPKTADEINEAFQNVAVDGLQSLNDGIADAITGSKSLADVFKNVANQIIADLIRIQVQKALAQGLSKALGSLSPSSSGISGSSGGGNMSGWDGAIQGMASGGSFMVGGKTGVDSNILSVNGIPRARVSHNENVSVGYGSNAGGGGGIATIVPSKYFDVVVDQRAAGVAGGLYTSGARANARRNRMRLA